MDEAVWVSAAELRSAASNASPAQLKRQRLQAEGQTCGHESDLDADRNDLLRHMPPASAAAAAGAGAGAGAGAAAGCGSPAASVGSPAAADSSELRIRRSTLSSLSSPPAMHSSMVSVIIHSESDGESGPESSPEDNLSLRSPAAATSAAAAVVAAAASPSAPAIPQGGARSRTQALIDDLSRLKEALRPPASPAAGGGIFSQVGTWLSCFWNAPETKPGVPAADPFNIRFEDVKELKWLGAGAHGCVFLGTYNYESVAIKKLRENVMPMREVRLLKHLRHENIVELKGVCTQPPVYCIVMEYCPQSLSDVIRDNHIPPPMVLDWARQVANGMHYLHSQGMVHRDLKSPNILIAQDKRTLKISDFGCSREVGERSTKMSFSGTVAWMAPEIIRGEACTDKIDVWSFGVVLWELLTGELPYKGVDVAAVVWGVGSGKLQLPIPESAPDGFTLLLKQCWNAHPKHRPSFRQILLHLDILRSDTEFAAMPEDEFYRTQLKWKQEIVERFEAMRQAETQLRERDERLIRQREEELKHAAEVRQLYEKRLAEAAEILDELRERESKLRKRERELEKRAASANRRAPNSQRKRSRGGNRDRWKRGSGSNHGSGNWDEMVASAQEVLERNADRDPDELIAKLERALEVTA